MDRQAVAKELRKALFDHIESEHREALQDEAVDKLFEGILAKHDKPTHWHYPSVSIQPPR